MILLPSVGITESSVLNECSQPTEEAAGMSIFSNQSDAAVEPGTKPRFPGSPVSSHLLENIINGFAVERNKAVCLLSRCASGHIKIPVN